MTTPPFRLSLRSVADFAKISQDSVERFGVNLIEEYVRNKTTAPDAPPESSLWTTENWQEWADNEDLVTFTLVNLWEREGVPLLCSWRECKYHDCAAPTKRAACKGCGEVRYCGWKCQRRDWVEGGHKAHCGRRLKHTDVEDAVRSPGEAR
ncbi:hypothetical protein PENSPDRAFT_693346 [Peniophora sp. CONT]|nr:hypothetical protein PENSPDRAFT_693346 [Peniophora sp. CONT]